MEEEKDDENPIVKAFEDYHDMMKQLSGLLQQYGELLEKKRQLEKEEKR